MFHFFAQVGFAASSLLLQQGEGAASLPSPTSSLSPSSVFASAAKISAPIVFGNSAPAPLRSGSSIRFAPSVSRKLMDPSQWSSLPVSFEQIYKSLAWVCVGWYIFVWFVCSLGYLEMRKRYAKPLPKKKPIGHGKLPFVSILRPIKGVDPHLALTLNSTFHIEYPSQLHEIVFCIASPSDPAVPIVRSLITQYPHINAKLLIAQEDVGPNPKIRTISKAYREAKGDIVWVIDSNVWLPSGILERSIRDLCGLDEDGNPTRRPYKLLHHLPIAVEADEEDIPGYERTTNKYNGAESALFPRNILNTFGAALEETFLSTSHCKFYTAINTLNVAPCALGKSTMWRKSHLAAITPPESPGIIHFAPYICEDHMLGAHIYEKKLPQETGAHEDRKEKWGRHIMGSDLVYQPLTNMRVRDYIDRRTRWIRVRKFAVISATFLEPNTESAVCNLWGAYGVITLLERHGYMHFDNDAILVSKCACMALFWVLSMALWSYLDYYNFKVLHSFASVPRNRAANSVNLPQFITQEKRKRKWESPMGWATHWIAREFLALPIWLTAMLSNRISWRGGQYVLRWDMTATEVKSGKFEVREWEQEQKKEQEGDGEEEEEEEDGNGTIKNRNNTGRHSRSKSRGKRKRASGGSDSIASIGGGGTTHQQRLSLKLL